MAANLLLLALLPVLPSHPTAAASPSPSVVQDTKKDDAEFEKRRNEAGDDVSKLWKLYEWCKQTAREKDGKATLRKIVKIDPNHKEANLALGNVFYDGKWFPNDKKIEEYKKEKEAKTKKDQGLVEWKGQWVPAADVPYLEKGLTKDADGKWVDADVAKKLAEGWVRDPDQQWIPPNEKENLDKGLWKCGDQWLSLDDANKYHSEIGKWWRVPFERYTVYSTCDRQLITDKISFELNRACLDLDKAYGTKLTSKPIVIVLRSQDQYANYAAPSKVTSASTPTAWASRPCTTHARRRTVTTKRRWRSSRRASGIGIRPRRRGINGVRARSSRAGRGIREQLDPSQKAFEKPKKQFDKFDGRTFEKAYWEEKRMPMWVRVGASTYAERYYTDPTPGLAGDPQWARKWSVGNIVTKGGLRPFKQIFDFKLSRAIRTTRASSSTKPGSSSHSASTADTSR
jgi:hypothetical protein